MKQTIALLLCCLLLSGCRQEPEIKDYTDDVLGIWYAVEYDECVEFLADGTVEDTYNGTTPRGFWKLDNETALLWINFGDDIFSIRISDMGGKSHFWTTTVPWFGKPIGMLQGRHIWQEKLQIDRACQVAVSPFKNILLNANNSY